MACYKPKMAWQSKGKNPQTGKSYIFFRTPQNPQQYDYVQIACQKCIGCRLDRSLSWAIRGSHEAQMHDQNCFITLTFTDDHILDRPIKDKKGNIIDYQLLEGSLHKPDFQNFMKRLRKYYVPPNPYCSKTQEEQWKKWQFDNGIRFLHAGEYGENTQRPHHHAILFGHDFDDKQLVATRDGKNVYTSETLNNIWGFGKTEIGECNFQTIGYVARYCCKKVGEPNSYIGNKKLDAHGRIKEYNTMSRKPGIGKEFLEKYGDTDIWNDGTVKINGKKITPPRYYMLQYEATNPEEYVILKEEQREQAKDNPDSTFERLEVREKVKESQIQSLTRTL